MFEDFPKFYTYQHPDPYNLEEGDVSQVQIVTYDREGAEEAIPELSGLRLEIEQPGNEECLDQYMVTYTPDYGSKLSAQDLYAKPPAASEDREVPPVSYGDREGFGLSDFEGLFPEHEFLVDLWESIQSQHRLERRLIYASVGDEVRVRVFSVWFDGNPIAILHRFPESRNSKVFVTDLSLYKNALLYFLSHMRLDVEPLDPKKPDRNLTVVGGHVMENL